MAETAHLPRLNSYSPNDLIDNEQITRALREIACERLGREYFESSLMNVWGQAEGVDYRVSEAVFSSEAYNDLCSAFKFQVNGLDTGPVDDIYYGVGWRGYLWGARVWEATSVDGWTVHLYRDRVAEDYRELRQQFPEIGRAIESGRGHDPSGFAGEHPHPVSTLREQSFGSGPKDLRYDLLTGQPLVEKPGVGRFDIALNKHNMHP